MPDTYIDASFGGTSTGAEATPWKSFEEAWEAEDSNIDPGEDWNFFFTGTSVDTNTTDPGVLMDNWPGNGTDGAGDCTITFTQKSGSENTSTANFDTGYYRFDHFVAGNNAINITDGFRSGNTRKVVFDGIQLLSRSTASGSRIIGMESECPDVTIQNCRLRHTGNTTFPRIVRADGTGGTAIANAITLEFIQNLVTYNGGANTVSTLNVNDRDVTCYVYNNTVYYETSAGEDFYDDVAQCAAAAIVNNVLYASGSTLIEIDTATNSPSPLAGNATPVEGDRGTGGTDVHATDDFTTGGATAASVLTPAASQANNWDEMATTNADDSRVPTTDIRGNARNTTAGSTTSAGCFARSGEGAAGGTTYQGVANITGTVTVTAAASQVHTAAANIAGVTTVTAAANQVHTGLAGIAGVGTVTADAQRITSGVADIGGVVTVTADALRTTSGVADISATLTMTVDGQQVHTGVADMSGVLTMTAAASQVHTGVANIASALTVTINETTVTAGGTTYQGVADISANLTMTAAANQTHLGVANVSSSLTTTIDGQRTTAGVADISALLSMSADANQIHVGVADIAGQLTMTATGNQVHQAVMAANAVLTMTARGTHIDIDAEAGGAHKRAHAMALGLGMPGM